MDDNWVPVIAIVCVFGLPVGAFVVFRVLAHRERIEMIRRGIVPPTGKFNAGQYAGAQNARDAYAQTPVDASRLLGKGIRLAFVGMALTIGLAFIGYHQGDVTRVGDVVVHDGAHWDFGPWLLGGLIPLFIGLSQVTVAFLTSPELLARYRNAGPRNGPAPGAYGAAEPDPASSQTSANGPYTYRPGGTQELRPPTPPPTRRP